MAEPAPNSEDQARWKTIAAQAKTLAGNPGSTIGRRNARLDSSDRAALGQFEQSPPPRPTQDRLTIGEVIGEGGMGVVRLATQVAMGRSVAVKTVRPVLRDAGPTLKLLQEAWTAGQLEHPNIIPVYDIATGDDGEPLIVLKRIAGESWSWALDNPEAAAARYEIDDTLDWHLRVLMQVCNAVHFAHDRGIVHLDIKPDNVMIGDHGEVYVVDWGIALALRDDGSGRLPLATKHTGIIGTPYYMAPEMLDGDGTGLEARTDVYLLGATLHEVLEGHPPHRGETIMEALHAALHRPVALSDDTPGELQRICRRALSRKVSQRFASAQELRRALQDFLRHRDSERMASEAHTRLAQLRAAIEQDIDADLHDSFGRIRFGFEQALASWPDNDAAQRGLAEAFEAVIVVELDRGDPEVAASLSQQAPSLPDSLRERITAQVHARRVGRDELEGHRLDADLRVGQRTRFFVFLVMGALWTTAPQLGNWLDHHGSGYTYAWGLTATGIAIGLGLGLAIWARESLSRTRANRLMMTGVGASLVTQGLLIAAGWKLGIDPAHIICLAPLTWALGAVVPAVAADRRVWAVVANFAAAAMLAVLFVPWRWHVLSASTLVCMLLAAVFWWPSKSTPPTQR